LSKVEVAAKHVANLNQTNTVLMDKTSKKAYNHYKKERTEEEKAAAAAAAAEEGEGEEMEDDEDEDDNDNDDDDEDDAVPPEGEYSGL
jgi:hypothetical protein